MTLNHISLSSDSFAAIRNIKIFKPLQIDGEVGLNESEIALIEDLCATQPLCNTGKMHKVKLIDMDRLSEGHKTDWFVTSQKGVNYAELAAIISQIVIPCVKR